VEKIFKWVAIPTENMTQRQDSGRLEQVCKVEQTVNSLKDEARVSFLQGDLEQATEHYCRVLHMDPVDSLKFLNEPDKILLHGDIPESFNDIYENLEFHKSMIHQLAKNMNITVDNRFFNPLSGYKDFWGLLKRSCKQKEVSGILTYGVSLITGIIPPYADFIDWEKDNKIDKLIIRPAGFSISPLAPLLAFTPKWAMVYGVALAAYHVFMHGYYNGTKKGKLRTMGHEYTHFHQVLTTQRMHNDGFCSDVSGFLDQAYNEFESFSLNKLAIREDIEEFTPKVVRFVLEYEKQFNH